MLFQDAGVLLRRFMMLWEQHLGDGVDDQAGGEWHTKNSGRAGLKSKRGRCSRHPWSFYYHWCRGLYEFDLCGRLAGMISNGFFQRGQTFLFIFCRTKTRVCPWATL